MTLLFAEMFYAKVGPTSTQRRYHIPLYGSCGSWRWMGKGSPERQAYREPMGGRPFMRSLHVSEHLFETTGKRFGHGIRFHFPAQGDRTFQRFHAGIAALAIIQVSFDFFTGYPVQLVVDVFRKFFEDRQAVFVFMIGRHGQNIASVCPSKTSAPGEALP